MSCMGCAALTRCLSLCRLPAELPPIPSSSPLCLPPSEPKTQADAATHEGRHDSLVAARGDSVATMADLEAGRGGGGAAASSSAAADGGMVPVQHVRRLTTTLVDILRHVAANPSAAGGGEVRLR